MTFNKTEDIIKYLITNKDISEIGIDLETTGLSPHEDFILLVSVSFRDKVFLLVGNDIEKSTMSYLLNLINERKILAIGHNVKFDVKFLFHNYDVLLLNLFDTMLAENLAYAGISKYKFSSLNELSIKYAGVNLEKNVRESFIGKLDYQFTEEQIKYAKIDSAVLFPIKDKLVDLLRKKGQYKTWELESKLEPVVAYMEYKGILFDKETWLDLAVDAERHLVEKEITVKKILDREFDKFCNDFENAYEALERVQYPVKSAFKVAEKNALKEVVVYDDIKKIVIDTINFGSYKQVGHIMRSLGVKAKTTNAKELLMHVHEHELVKHHVELKEYKKKVESFGEDFLKYMTPTTGAIHCSLNQLGTQTGRFSSDNPNLQNIIADKVYREAFIARDGYKIATVDYSNIELRIMGEVSKEPLYVEAFKKGLDLHRQTASLVFQVPYDEVTKEQRKLGKNLNYAIIYGTTAMGIAYNFGLPLSRGKELLDNYFELHWRLKAFIDEFAKKCLKFMFSTTMGGRKRFLSIDDTLHKKSKKYFIELNKAKRKAVNTLPQGTSADMIKWALIYSFYENPFGLENFRPLLTVHDEIVFEYKEDMDEEKVIEFIDYCMSKAGKLYLKTIPEEHEIKIDKCWRK